MEFLNFKSRIQDILKTQIPNGNIAAEYGRTAAGQIKIGRTAFMDKMGVSSEAEYKLQCIKKKQITFHGHIGLNSWDATANAITKLYQSGLSEGFDVARVGICLDRRMGLPDSKRKEAIAETGPMLNCAEDWMAIGKIIPIQPHMGDFMIGFPASFENTIHALEAGVTTIGNLSQYFSHEAPGFKDHVFTTNQTVKAISLMGGLREKGALVHSYFEDGFGALFYDCATIAGWAFLEKYIVETLLGAKLSHCIGGLTIDPVKRAGWVFALDKIHDHECIGSMFYGDTISFTRDLSYNAGLVSEYLMWDILAQMKCPTGHAVLPLPLTEGVRIPSVEEIIQAQILGKRIEKTAQRLYPYFDFTQAQIFAKNIVSKGKIVFNNALDGFLQAGVNIKDPVELLFVLKKLGPSVFEEMFGAGTLNENFIRNREPIVKTDIFKQSKKSIEKHRKLFQSKENITHLKDRRLVIASSDVHEHAIMILSQLCREAGAQIFYLGAEKNPDELAAFAVSQKADGILLSTHNGMALEYAKDLRIQLDNHECRIPVIMGGVLNQKMDNCELPVDVSSNLKKLGFIPHAKLEDKFTYLLASAPAVSPPSITKTPPVK